MREMGQVDIHRQGMGMVKYGDEGVGSGHVKHSDMEKDLGCMRVGVFGYESSGYVYYEKWVSKGGDMVVR